MRVLIVCCGYVGFPPGVALVQQGHEVFGLRRTNSANAKMEAAGIKPLNADITRLPELQQLSPEFEWVINLVSSSKGGIEEYREVYLHGMSNLIQWLEPAPLKKFVYTSSTSVYGQTDGSVVRETSPTDPVNETAQVLVETEKLLMENAPPRRPNFPALILRVAGIYGPERGYWLRNYLQGEARIQGHGERILNMIHLDDLVGIILSALQAGVPGEISK